ncbi:hypothetical protein TNCV_1243091 [Trichonephila clavipes]|nr:hypothetical protein TNCV_1243091 [Trichonephila clavipes]
MGTRVSSGKVKAQTAHLLKMVAPNEPQLCCELWKTRMQLCIHRKGEYSSSRQRLHTSAFGAAIAGNSFETRILEDPSRDSSFLPEPLQLRIPECGFQQENPGVQEAGKSNKKCHYVPGGVGIVWPTSKVKTGLRCHQNVEHETWSYVSRNPADFFRNRGVSTRGAVTGARSNEE